jgi:hypothetical protein
MKPRIYEPLAIMLFKLFKRGIESKNENDSNKQKDRDSEKDLNQTKQAQRIEK